MIVRRRKIDGGDLVVMNGGHIARELRGEISEWWDVES